MLVFYFYFYSLNSFDNALVFKTLDDDDIAYVQEFVRKDLLEILERYSSEHSCVSSDLKIHLFGDFVCNPEKFCFSKSELNLIKNINQHIAAIEKSKKKITDHFTYNENIECHIENRLPNGPFFTTYHYVFSENTRNVSTQTEVLSSKAHQFIDKLSKTADQNKDRTPTGYRYDDDSKQFFTYMRMVAGPLAYETLQRNMESEIPSLNSVNRYIRENNEIVIDGELRSSELLQYLQKRNLPLIVALSEDATRINGRPQYDKKSNQIYGFVTPTNQQNGMPIPFSFPARNANEISHYFESNEPLADYVNVVMAQPLAEVSPFCLLMFSSDNKYTTDIVCKRWEFISEELRKLNIIVASIASDSDPRFNSAMRRLSQLGQPSTLFSEYDWFSCDKKPGKPCCIQDPPHIITKLRSLFLKTNTAAKKLSFGPKYFIQIKHLEYLIKNFSKTEHLLTLSDLYPEDKQNYPSALKICDERVINLLNEKLPEARATAMFLRIMRNSVDAYQDKQLYPLQRVDKSFYALFMTRIWREYVSSSKKRTLEENFLTNNCYSCIELNAHSLVFLLLHLKDMNAPHLLLLHLMDSQSCEGFFRQLRSMSTSNSTVVNCTMKEILHRVNRINFQNEISLNENFIFPRVKSYQPNSSNKNGVTFELPTKDEIIVQIEMSRLRAITDSQQFGFNKSLNDKLQSKLPIYKPMKRRVLNPKTTNLQKSTPIFKSNRIILKNFAEKFVNQPVDELSPYVELNQANNDERMIVKKTSLCWALTKGRKKLSSDRLIRVRAPKVRKAKCK